jgi:signal transduction histidine kinase
MKTIENLRRGALALRWRFLSAPIFVKILGIGALAAVIFGFIIFFEARGSMSRILYLDTERSALSTARSLADALERPMATGDFFTVNGEIRKLKETFPDIRYIIVRSAADRIVAHTFIHGVPDDLAVTAAAARPEGGLRVVSTGEGDLFEARSPILAGRAGVVQLGMGDRVARNALATLTRSVLLSLAISIVLASGLALVQRNILVRPVHHLERTSQRIREGHFESRAEVFSDDEIGHLAVSFNEMARSLQRYRGQVEEKEKARLAMMEKIVLAQEEERKIISRELHDQFGQSLLAVLLSIQSSCKFSSNEGSACHQIEKKLRLLIDEVHRLAWGMRPSILDDYGLDSALTRYIEEISKHLNFAIDYQYTPAPGVGRLPNAVEITLYRVAQEAITNIVSHAQATRASVVILHQPGEVTLVIEDNGRGFDPKTGGTAGGHLGLAGMRERVALLGGTIEIESAPGEGTTIQVRVPPQGRSPGDEKAPDAAGESKAP